MSSNLLHDRVARNQSHFREINERIEPSNAAHSWSDPPFPDWICECARADCSDPVRLTVAEYESVRSTPSRFLVAPSDEHVLPELEQVVDRNERYWVVEKRGLAGDVSEELDPRIDDE